MKNLLRYIGGGVTALLFFCNVPVYQGHTGLFHLRAAEAAVNPNWIRSIDSIAELEARDWSNYPYLNVLSYVAGKNKGGGLLYLNSTDTTSATNACTIFLDTSGNRFYREMAGPLSLPQCGALGDGATDDTAASVAAMTVGAANNLTVDGGGLSYVLTSGIGVDVCHTSLNNAHLVGTSIASGRIVGITTSCPDPNIMSSVHAAHALYGLVVDGPDSAASTTRCVELVPEVLAGVPWIPNVSLIGGGTTGCNVGVYMAGGAFDTLIKNFPVASAVGRGYKFGVFYDAGANNGERNVIENVQFDNGATINPGCALTNATAGDVHVNHSSFDGGNCFISAAGSGAVVEASGSHFESFGADVASMLNLTAQNASIRVSDSYFAIDVVRATPIASGLVPSNVSPFNTGGFVFDNVYFNFGGRAYPFDYIAAGAAPVQSHAVTFETDDVKPVMSVYTGLIVDPFFNNSLADWTASGVTGNFTRVTGGGGPEGQSTYANMTNSGGGVSIVSGAFPCSGGQLVALSWWLETTGMTSSASSFTELVQFFDANGHVIGQTNGQPITADVAIWTMQRVPAPFAITPGTVSCKVSFGMGNPASGSATVGIGGINFQAL